MKMKSIICLLLCIVMCISSVATLASCNNGDNGNNQTAPTALVMASEALDGVFNPFFSTTGADGSVVGLTQIGMLTTGYEQKPDGSYQATVAYGDNEAVVTKDLKEEYNSTSETTTYTFVIKNGIKFSDGKPLTIGDVLFNMYVYLDPVYTGSSTMYSTDIVGLSNYRTQSLLSDDSNADSALSQSASDLAKQRRDTLINLFRQVGQTPTAGSYSANESKMTNAINSWTPTPGYKNAISSKELTTEEYRAQLLKDYQTALKYFKEELGTDYASAQEAFPIQDAPYKDWKDYFQDPVFCFMLYEGFVTIEYEKDANNKDIKTQIKKITKKYNDAVVVDMDSAINYVYTSNVTSKFDQIISYWATSQTILSEYTAKAKEVLLNKNTTGAGLVIPNISGIVSLGHTTEVQTVTIGDKTYNVAHEHNEDGTPKNADEYDVLQITINDVDPKAIWNFAFTVAPQHYYAGSCEVDIANNKFGVVFGSYDFMTKTLQNPAITNVPMGAGPYVATNENNEDNPTGNEFYNNNVVYYKANTNYLMGTPKIDKVRYKVVTTSNILNALEKNEVHYASPQLTNYNIEQLEKAAGKGIRYTYTDQLGYGYIGINAGKVQDINLRRAIMAAMNTRLALSYYRSGTAQTIYWPMSTVSWAYPTDQSGNPSKDNGHGEYIAINFDRETAKQTIKDYMEAAGVSAGDPDLKIKFTVAGSSLTDHPTYLVFQEAADLLNECGWSIEVVADSQALTKLSTGSLSVWAAAWGSSVDPDMYQVYHKNSTTTSVLAWGYREMLASPDLYPEETGILTDLSVLIDEARETTDQEVRASKYKEAMSKVLDLAVELPVYQRSVLYAYNSNVIKESTMPTDINPYSSPLDRIWEIEFAQTASEGGSENEGGLGTGAVIGIIIGAVVVIAGAAAGVFFFMKSKKAATEVGFEDGEVVVAVDSDEDVTVVTDTNDGETQNTTEDGQ